MIPVHAPSVMFLSDMCLLDRNSGAAIEMHDWLHRLAREGFGVHSVTMSLFDGGQEYPLQQELMPNIDPAEHVGKRIRLNLDGIEHNIFNVGTSIARNLQTNHISGFVSAAAEDIRRIQPDIVIGYGSVNLVPLRALARELGARCVFYLANDSYTADKRQCFDEIDKIVVPSQALADFYRERLGLSAEVIGNYLPDYEAINRPSQREIEDRRRLGFLTMVNPSLTKGGLYVLQMATILEKLEPDITFVAVESRVTRSDIYNFVNNASKIRNIWWLPRQADLHRLYRRSAFVLMPSVCFEAAGRVVAEAQLHGVPVIAHHMGALPEQVGEGGKLINIPSRLQGNMTALPSTHEVTPWVNAIREGLQKKRYHEMVRRALTSGARHSPERRWEEILAFFRNECSTARSRKVE